MNNPISQPYLQCERLDVYRVAVKFHRSIVPLRQVRGIAELRDQLMRASESVVLNVAEGAGRFSHADKRHFYRIANGSAMKAAIPRGGFDETIIQEKERVQCFGALELLHNRGILSAAGYQARRDLLIRLVQMLARLCGLPR